MIVGAQMKLTPHSGAATKIALSLGSPSVFLSFIHPLPFSFSHAQLLHSLNPLPTIVKTHKPFLDPSLYHSAITPLAIRENPTKAFFSFVRVALSDRSPDPATSNSLLAALSSNGEDLLRPARKLWDEMFTHGCKGNLQTYNILIGKFSDACQVQEANYLFCHMLEKGVRPNEMTCPSLIKGLCREGMIDSAYEVFNTSLEQDIVLAESTMNTLIRCLCREEIDMSIKHIGWIQESSYLKLEAISCELVALFSFSSKLEPILQLLQEMVRRGLASAIDPWINIGRESFSW